MIENKLELDMRLKCEMDNCEKMKWCSLNIHHEEPDLLEDDDDFYPEIQMKTIEAYNECNNHWYAFCLDYDKTVEGIEQDAIDRLSRSDDGRCILNGYRDKLLKDGVDSNTELVLEKINIALGNVE